MPIAKWYSKRSLGAWLNLMVGLGLLAGCCYKHLYIYRETPQKEPPAQVALVVTDPNLMQAVLPGADLHLQGAPWAPDQPSYSTEVYRMAISRVDDRKVYQGQCLDIQPTYAVELKPGARRLAVRVDLLGPKGQEIFTDTVQVNLQAGHGYFLRPDWQELLNRRLAIKTETLPEAYTPGFRARVIDWEKKTNSKASLD
jgi:hypothetical protein